MGGSGRKDALWTWAKRALALAIVAVAAFLLYRTLSEYGPGDIVASIKKVPLSRIVLATGFAGASYFCLTWFDWLALHYAGKPLSYRRAALASFCSLSLGHNIGFAALSSGAIRLRFYSRWGLRVGDVAKVILFSAATVGLGMVTIGGIALLLRSGLGAQITGLSRSLALGVGAICLAVPAAYVALAIVLRRPLTVRGWSVRMPEPRLALAQIAVGTANYACVAACLYQTLAGVAEVSYFSVAAAYVVANGTALLAHVPGGLGVIEGVVILLLPGAGSIGAVLLFRAIYFLLPLSIGGPLFAITELYYSGKPRRAAKTA